MSADNGVYIARFPVANSDAYEWRVAHAQNIEDTEDSDKPQSVTDAYRLIVFGDTEILLTAEAALQKAAEIYSDLTVCEYGICSIEFDRPLATFNAKAVLHDFFGDKAKARKRMREEFLAQFETLPKQSKIEMKPETLAEIFSPDGPGAQPVNQCESTCFDRADGQMKRCYLEHHPDTDKHDDGCMGWTECTDPRWPFRLTDALQKGSWRVGLAFQRLGKWIDQTGFDQAIVLRVVLRRWYGNDHYKPR